jgi:hypothetical protein
VPPPIPRPRSVRRTVAHALARGPLTVHGLEDAAGYPEGYGDAVRSLVATGHVTRQGDLLTLTDEGRRRWAA